MKSAISLQGTLRVEYRIRLQPMAGATSLIASEQRFAGGSATVAALALASLGASVRLSGSPIGDDSHGRFLRAQLENVPGLELEVETRSEVVTPYAILVREEEGTTRTWLSPEAAQLEDPQDYPSLLDALKQALTQWYGNQSAPEDIDALVNQYDVNFGLSSFREEK